MADDHLPGKPGVTFDFDLPHGIDVEEGNHELQLDAPTRSATVDASWSLDHLTENGNQLTDPFGSSNHQDGTAANRHDDNEQELEYRQFSPGFSDDEGSREAFERSWSSHQAKKQAVKAAKGKKSPRRSNDEGDDSESSVRAKKPRQFLFSGTDEEKEDEAQVDNLLAPATPEHGIGNRMSSLNLDQQQNGDEDMDIPMKTGFGLACSDIGSVRDSPVPSDNEFVIPPDTVVSCLNPTLMYSEV